MIIANTTIRVNDAVYTKGQAVKGLSDDDIKWMSEKGYITLMSDSKKDVKSDKKK